MATKRKRIPRYSKVQVNGYEYYKTDIVSHKVMGMWLAYYEAYQDKAAEEKAHLEIKKTNARILMIAGGADEAWPEIIPHDSACRHDV